jgi:hypothetical protein
VSTILAGLVLVCLAATAAPVVDAVPGPGSRPASASGPEPTAGAMVLRVGPLLDLVLEFRVASRGPIAWRHGRATGGPDRVGRPAGRTVAWVLPAGDAVFIERDWWSPLARFERRPPMRPSARLRAAIRRLIAPADDGAGRDRLYEAALGDVTGDGRRDLVVAHRRPFRRTLINVTRPADAWRDRVGMSAHLGVYVPSTLRETWVAGTLVLPVVRLAVCDGSLAVAYGQLGSSRIVATGAWRWQGFGFLPSEPLPGPGKPVCVDADGDGRSEPAVLGREGP